MPRLRRLSGAEVVAILGRFEFVLHSRRGSHTKLRRTLPNGTTQTLTVPMHAELDTGTCRAMLRQASRFIAEPDLRPHLHGVSRRAEAPADR
jgi:predicted RNA binding protein YcfA (HicA-like mRNA interferase family)